MTLLRCQLLTGVLIGALIDPIEKVQAVDASCPCAMPGKPDLWDKEKTARWMVHTLDWGVLSTLSSRAADWTSQTAVPFGNVYSFIDGPCENTTGVPYFYGTFMDQSFQDMQKQPLASLTLSEAALASACAGQPTWYRACTVAAPNAVTSSWGGDPENPVCARLTLSGTLRQVPEGTDEFDWAQAAFFQRHPQMRSWPRDHNWVIVNLDIQDLWLIDYFGGASILDVPAYLATDLALPETSV